MQYRVFEVPRDAELTNDWNAPLWAPIPPATLECVRPESSDHHPETQVRLAYNGTSIMGIFQVHDRYVRCVATQFQDSVCRDSCVEFFVQPAQADKGYLNFEFSGGGAFLVYHVVDPRRVEGKGFKEYHPLSAEDGERVQVLSSLPSIVEPEITEPLTWTLAFALPVALLERHVGELGDLRGQSWRANFYKCGDQTSHPHWISWAPVDPCNFHLPDCFGNLVFAGPADEHTARPKYAD